MDQTIVTFLDRPGTYMYHAHYDLYDLHIYGALIVEGDKESVAMR